MKEQKVKLKKVLQSLILCMAVVSACLFGNVMKPGRVNAAETGFHVSGTSIKDANGNTFVMRGINIAHAWFPSNTKQSIQAAARLGANTVRVVVSDGVTYSKTSLAELQDIVNICKENKLVCILEVHDATGSDKTEDLNAAVNYWIENKSVLQENQNYVILNIANEWFGTWDGSAWAKGNKDAVWNLRQAGIKNLIMVDCAGWGQYPDSIRDYGRTVCEGDPDGNTMFSIHMYEYAGKDASTVKANIDNALGVGVPLCIGEFGAEHTNGDVDEATIMSYCQQKGAGYLGWSWKGNNDDLKFLDIANDWDGNSLTSWGNTLIYGSNGIKETSKICSVYSGQNSGSTGESTTGDSGNTSDSGNTENPSTNDSYTSLFWGEAEANSWDQAVTVRTSRSGGSFNAGDVQPGGDFYVEYTGTQDRLELILQSWSGGPDWAKVSMSESGEINGHYYAKYSYENCKAAFGTDDFAGKLDRIHVGAAGGYLKVYSLCYEYGTGSGSSAGENEDTGNTDISDGSESNQDTGNADDSLGESSYESLFWGEASADNWNQAVSVDTDRNGGSFAAGNVQPGGHFYVEYSGSKEKLDLVLQSWSGGSEWGKVSISESGEANGHYYAVYSYDNCVKAFGSDDFAGKLDRVHVSAMDEGVTVYSVCYDYGK
ncbi:MAG: cellulase family glycosylhydrolase [Lachnospiraceae bacterium]